MDKCPKCESKIRSHERSLLTFQCGSVVSCDGGMYPQSELCKDIAFLRERVAYLEKWRNIVLHAAWPGVGYFEVDIGQAWSNQPDIRCEFDEAVKKEIGVSRWPNGKSTCS